MGDDGGPDSAPDRRRRRWPWVVGGVVVVAIAVLAVVWVTRPRAHQVSLEEARQRLTSTTTTVAGSESSSGSLTAPRPGVYAYRGTGTEQLSLPPLSQPEGPTIPGTVTLQPDGCWQLRFDYSSNHWQTWRYCRSGSSLVEAGGQTWQRWMIGVTAVTNLSNFTCTPPAMVLPEPRRPGQTWAAHCAGGNTAVSGTTVSAGPYRFVGEETVTVGGTKVRAAHFLRERTMSGAQRGSEHSDVWFADGTGLPIRNRRTITVRSDTPVGTSTYTERGELLLTSLTPTG